MEIISNRYLLYGGSGVYPNDAEYITSFHDLEDLNAYAKDLKEEWYNVVDSLFSRIILDGVYNIYTKQVEWYNINDMFEEY